MGFQSYRVPFEGPGAFSLMPCPPSDGLDAALDQLQAQGVTTVISMLALDERSELGMEGEASACARRSISFLSYPIPDFGLPDLVTFHQLIDAIVASMANAEHVAVHCRAGIGRSGIVAAATLIALGQPHQIARDVVSIARGVSIPDTVEQATFLATFQKSLNCG